MKKYLPLAAAVGATVAAAAIITVAAVLVFGSGDKPGPDTIASKWAHALATHDYAAACSYESAAYSGGKLCAASYKESFDAIRAATGRDVVKDLEHVGTCAVIDTPGKPPVAYCYVTGPNLNGQVPTVVLERSKNGTWHVAFLA